MQLVLFLISASFHSWRDLEQLEWEPHPLEPAFSTAAPDHRSLPGPDRGQGVGATGPGEVRHYRHSLLLQSLQGKDTHKHTRACVLDSPLFLKVTCIDQDQPHTLPN